MAKPKRTIEVDVSRLPNEQERVWHLLKVIGELEDISRHVLLHGLPGTGKSSFGHTLAQATTDGVAFNVQCSRFMVAQENLATMMPNEQGGLSLHLGAFMRAWTTPGTLVLDEIDQGMESDAAPALFKVLDDPKVAFYTPPVGPTLRPKPGFRCVATTNEKDPSAVMPAAVFDRFHFRVRVDMPSVEALATIKSDKVREMTHNGYKQAGGAKEKLPWSFREAANFDRLLEVGVHGTTAARLVWGANGRKVLDALAIGVATTPEEE